MKIKELFSDESKWTKGAYCRNEHGQMMALSDPGPSCYCLSGAIFICYLPCEQEIIRDRIGKAVESHVSVAHWNDDPDRTFEEVKALVNKLDI